MNKMKKFENTEALTVAYYISKFEGAYDHIGNSRLSNNEVHKKVASFLGTKASTIKNYRDEFDPLFPNNGRAGWHQRKMLPSRTAIHEKYKNMSESDFKKLVDNILKNEGYSSIEIQQSQKDNKNFNLNEPIQLRRFNSSGLQKYRKYVLTRIEDPQKAMEIDLKLLLSNEFSESLEDDEHLIDPNKKFKDSYELGEYLYQVLSGFDYDDICFDHSLWNWLSLLYFNQTFPGPRGGVAPQRYILSEDPRRYYRCLIRTPWELFYFLREDARVCLTKAINVGSDDLEAIISRPELYTNKVLIQTIAKLYVTKTGSVYSFKRKALDKETKTPGCLRRLITFTKQISLNHDVRNMDQENFQNRLPTEFDNWL